MHVVQLKTDMLIARLPFAIFRKFADPQVVLHAKHVNPIKTVQISRMLPVDLVVTALSPSALLAHQVINVCLVKTALKTFVLLTWVVIAQRVMSVLVDCAPRTQLVQMQLLNVTTKMDRHALQIQIV